MHGIPLPINLKTTWYTLLLLTLRRKQDTVQHITRRTRCMHFLRIRKIQCTRRYNIIPPSHHHPRLPCYNAPYPSSTMCDRSNASFTRLIYRMRTTNRRSAGPSISKLAKNTSPRNRSSASSTISLYSAIPQTNKSSCVRSLGFVAGPENEVRKGSIAQPQQIVQGSLFFDDPTAGYK